MEEVPVKLAKSSSTQTSQVIMALEIARPLAQNLESACVVELF